MEVSRLSIEGTNRASLVDSLKKELPDYYMYISKNVFIFTTQKFYLRTSSNLLSVIILDYKDRHRCNVEIISGGGGSGLLQITLDSESSSNNEIINVFEKICGSYGWILQKR